MSVESRPKPPSRHTKIPSLWLYLFFYQLPVDMYQRAFASAHPIAILSSPPSPSVLWTNHLATEKGIQAGMALHTALCLASDLRYVTYQEMHSIDQLKALAQWAYAYSDSISLYIPDGLMLEVGSMCRLFGGISNLVRQIQDDLDQLGFGVRLATGYTPLSARILACAGTQSLSEDKMSTDALLSSIALSECFLPDGLPLLMERMGLTQLHQLQAIPHRELGQRFGKGLCDHLARIYGDLPSPQKLYHSPEHYLRRLDFMHEIEFIAGLLFPLKRMLGELALFLQMRAKATDQIELSLLHREGAHTALTVHCATPQTQSGELLKLATLKLDKLVLSSPVTGMQLRAQQLQDAKPEELDFFKPAQSKEEATQLVSRLIARLGENAVCQSDIHDDYRPENAGIIQPIHQLARLAARLSRPPHEQPPTASPRPIWLCPSPYPIHNTPVSVLCGPERISAGWWSESKVTRDYYIARFANGSIGWIFRNSSGEWYLHGWFG